jgi:biopolymer transport protein ExbB
MWNQLMSYFPLLEKGGPVMIPIILGSIIGLAIIAERFWALVLRRSRIMPRGLLAEVQDRLGRGEINEAITACKRDDSSLARILLAGLRYQGAGREIIRESLEDVGRREASELERYLALLGTITAVEPLLGLLGTVTGMIKMFGVIGAEGPGNPAHLAVGIAEALITTAGGLTVAIPCYLSYRWFLSRVQRIVQEMEDHALGLLDQLQAEEDRARQAPPVGKEPAGS